MKLPSPYDRMLAPVYVPTLLMAISEQALIILLPLYVLELGYGPAFAALVVGLRGIGVLLFDVPAGMLVDRFGDKPVLLGGLCAILGGLLTLAWSSDPWMLAGSALALGAGSAAWLLGRQSYVTDTSAPQELGRAIAVMAGLQRMGAFVGPAAGGALAELLGYPIVFLAGGVCAVGAGALVVIYTRHVPPHRSDFGPGGTLRVIHAHAKVFATAGIAAFALQLMRATRQLLVPLFGQAVGLDAAAIGLVYSLSAAVDMSLFYPVGVIADRWGRKWVALPSMVLFVTGLATLPLVKDFMSLLAAGVLLGFANGIGTGVLMIIGSDLAPRGQQSQFLGVWRLLGDIGLSGGPLLAGALVNAASLAAASLAVAGIGLLGAAALLFLVPESLRRAPDAPAQSLASGAPPGTGTG